MIVDFGDFDESAVARGAAGDESSSLEAIAEDWIELPTVAVSLIGQLGVVEAASAGFRQQSAGVSAEPHGAALLGHGALIIEQGDDGVLGVFVSFGGVGVVELETVAGEGDDHVLHAAAESEVGDALFERESGDADLAFNAALAEAARHDDAIDIGEGGGDLRLVGGVQAIGLDPADFDARTTLGAGVDQGFLDGEIGVAQLDILADDGDMAGALGGIQPGGPVNPGFDRAFGRAGSRGELESVEREVGEAGAVEHGGNLVDRGDGFQRHHGFGRDVAKEGEFVGDGTVGWDVGTGDDDVRLDAHAAQRANGVLGGLGLELVGRLEVKERRDMNRERAVSRLFVAHLADRFEEGLAFDVADGSADLNDQDVNAGLPGETADAFFDQIGDVRDGLDGAAEIVAAPFAFDHFGGDLTHGDGGGGRQILVEEALVVAEVKVGFGAVVGDVDLTVLIGGHGAGVNVEVRIELLDGDGESARLEETTERGGGDALADGGDDAAGDEDVLRRVVSGAHWRADPPCRLTSRST